MTKKAKPAAAEKPAAAQAVAAPAPLEPDHGLVLNKKRKLVEDYYGEDLDSDAFFEETDDDVRRWSIKEKLAESGKHTAQFVEFLDAKGFDYKYFQKNGFQKPIVFADKSGLGLRVPSENFKVNDVKACVGSKRVVDVVDVNTQKGLTMTMKDWCEYYNNNNNSTGGKRDRLLNVISLEFSHTKLENYVEAPAVVRQLDWIETAWPQHLREQHTESTNALDKMLYPKVQKYVLMSVADCYTDFHVDMGGTSVWYHILKGEKIFWLIPPTEKNLKRYEKWILSGDQTRVFLPDVVDECQRLVLKQGATLLMPSGWIHGVYTTRDSLVFGGNFLHSFNVPMQLKVYGIENRTKVPAQYRYPFYVEMMWFVVERYVHCLTGVTHLDTGDDGDEPSPTPGAAYKSFQPGATTLTTYELEGLRALRSFLDALGERRRLEHVPKEIVQAEKLFQTLGDVLEAHAGDAERSVSTGEPFMHWPRPDKKVIRAALSSNKKPASKKPSGKKASAAAVAEPNAEEAESEANTTSEMNYSTLAVRLNSSADDSTSSPLVSPTSTGGAGGKQHSRKHVMRNLPRTKGSIKKRLRPQNVPRSNVERRRRVRCHQCEPCTRDDCGECKYCKDMKKFGGTGVSKQCCLSKQCLQPLLPTTTTCMLCEVLIDRRSQEPASLMYECEVCFEIYHVQCFRKQYAHLDHIESVVNEDLVNCWQCANCINKGYMRLDNSLVAGGGGSVKQEPTGRLSQSFNETTSDSAADSSNLSTLFNVSSLDSTPVKSKKPGRPPKELADCKPVLSSSPIKATAATAKEETRVNGQTELINGKKAKKAKKSVKSVEIIDQDSDVDEDEFEITLESLTELEKQIILREFCANYAELKLSPLKSASPLKTPKSANKIVKNQPLECKNRPQSQPQQTPEAKKKKKKATAVIKAGGNGLLALTNGFHGSEDDEYDEEKLALLSIQRMLATESSLDKEDIVYEINDDSSFLKDKMAESSVSSMSTQSSVSSTTTTTTAAEHNNFKGAAAGKRVKAAAQVSALC